MNLFKFGLIISICFSIFCLKTHSMYPFSEINEFLDEKKSFDFLFHDSILDKIGFLFFSLSFLLYLNLKRESYQSNSDENKFVPKPLKPMYSGVYFKALFLFFLFPAYFFLLSDFFRFPFFWVIPISLWCLGDPDIWLKN